MASHSTSRTLPAQRAVLRASVVRTERITPHTVRVTVGGGDLGRFTPMGFDQWFRLVLPRRGQRELRHPSGSGMTGYMQYLSMPKSVQPIIRNYTVRAFRAHTTELDIDFVTHDGGEASAWAERARPGDPVAIYDEGTMFTPSPGADWTLLVGDESGLPAIAGICASLPRDTRGEAFLEIPSAADTQELDSPAGMTLHWLSREDPHDRPGPLVQAAVAAWERPRGRVAAFVVGETSTVASIRGFLIAERAVRREDVSFCGYWLAQEEDSSTRA